ncbi:unnamed protein product [Notodromas monacha]|uniref:ABC transporter domain-containing protein n=1 Tax=Notodromas monacha TaxID=399045 RepID=A0A7R9GDY6_9CRUS|nr:unnamed protein product [Notodromas monacha]CAG0917346.1 unnamed protein product [Notodromas monacha]
MNSGSCDSVSREETHLLNDTLTSDGLSVASAELSTNFLAKETPRKKDNYGSFHGPEPVVSYKDSASIAWKDLNMFVPAKKPTSSWPFKSSSLNLKMVLNGVSGFVKPGTLTAVMGSSGSGKTSLMNALAGRVQSDCFVDGHIAVNGRLCDAKTRSNSFGFVHQTDMFFGALTVREHLTFVVDNFNARLRVGRYSTRGEILQRVDHLLSALGLRKCQNTRIGIPHVTTGISGGERKRLAFASEIVTDPPLLFCDEPTTGLDSFTAWTVAKTMREIVSKSGKTIICSIHQPSSEVFDLFDHLILLSEGSVAFMGSKQAALSFFNDLGYRCPSTFSPADFYVHTLGIAPGRENKSRAVVRNICNYFAISREGVQIDQMVEHEFALAMNLESSSSSSCSSSGISSEFDCLTARSKPNWFIQFFVLLQRSALDAARNPGVNRVRTFQKLALAILVGLAFASSISMTQRGIQNITGAIFAIVTENTFPSLFGVLGSVPLELPLILREYQSGMFNLGPYYAAKALALIPGFILEPFLFTTLVYFIMGLRPGWYYFLQVLGAVLMTANAASACGCLFGMMFESVSVAIATLLPFDVTLMIFGGFFLRLDSVSPFLNWIQYISWFRYSTESLMISQYRNFENITCEPEIPQDRCLRTGNEVLNMYGFDPEAYDCDILILFIMYCFFHTCAYLALHRRARHFAN